MFHIYAFQTESLGSGKASKKFLKKSRSIQEEELDPEDTSLKQNASLLGDGTERDVLPHTDKNNNKSFLKFHVYISHIVNMLFFHVHVNVLHTPSCSKFLLFCVLQTRS